MKILFSTLFFVYMSTSFAQNFSSYSDVLVYTSGKVFQNSQGNVKISINENGIQVNGNNEYFNIEISVISSTIAIIKGQSLRNADGTISMRLNSSTGCIYQDGESYCKSSQVTINTSNLSSSFSMILPKDFSNSQYNHSFSFQKDGTGTAIFSGRAEWPLSWKILNSNEIEININTRISVDTYILTLGSTGGNLFFTKKDWDQTGAKIINTYYPK